MRIIIVILGFLSGLIIFAPKDNLYFSLQKELKKQNIYINSSIYANPIRLELLKGIVYVNGIDIAKFQKIDSFIFLLFNKISAKEIILNFDNLKINSLTATYTILNPLKIIINGNSNFGKIDGEINLKNRELKIYIINLTNNNLKNILKKDKKGYFYYEKF